jgi:hypothetical protein
MNVSGQLHAPAALAPGKELPVTHSTGSWLRFKAGMHVAEMRTQIHWLSSPQSVIIPTELPRHPTYIEYKRFIRDRESVCNQLLVLRIKNGTGISFRNYFTIHIRLLCEVRNKILDPSSVFGVVVQ